MSAFRLKKLTGSDWSSRLGNLSRDGAMIDFRYAVVRRLSQEHASLQRESF